MFEILAQLSPAQKGWVSGFIAVALVLAIVVRQWLNTHFSHFHHAVHLDTKRYKFLKHFLMGLVFFIVAGIAIYMIPPLRSLSVSIFAGAGVLAIIIGFASQHALANMISGVFIAIFKPFRVGDWVKVGNLSHGTVEDITLRHTVIRDRQNRRIIIPNSVISGEVIENSTIDDTRICQFFEIGISYDADADRAMEIMQEEAMLHPDFIDVRTKDEIDSGRPAVKVKVIGFGDSSVNLRAWVWTNDPYRAYQLLWDMNKKVKQRFDREGIEIPFPYRTVVYKKDLKRKGRKRKK